ncbi:hypothetical protein MTR_2g103270 [Medicago truncatula]|uniref:Uncharacterized protein n=1 Tax=Medicago truncatula TaxID=3880 RepID=G7IUS3_MEDTR|nr:hypothetical protein MTR_2g103270 [Medicago truncatula]
MVSRVSPRSIGPPAIRFPPIGSPTIYVHEPSPIVLVVMGDNHLVLVDKHLNCFK